MTRIDNSERIPHERVTGGLPVINTEHEAIHAGIAFVVDTWNETVADDATILLEMRTPAEKYIHVKKVDVYAEGGLAKLEIIEKPVVATGNTAKLARNRLRTPGAPAATTIFKTDPTSISGGTTIEGPWPLGGGGTGSGVGSASGKDDEFVPDRSAVYLFRVTNLAGAAKALGLRIFFYEENAV